ncbi:hypothetical protein ACFW04_014311 [Cataglyphis niger]
MNISNPRVRYTTAEYLEAVSKILLESNLNTIFATLRNTEQYWRKPRSDLNCVTQHYGSTTWFLTLSPKYQGRGIQHFHLLIWIKSAPIFGEFTIEEVFKFILQYIKCKMPDQNISPLLYTRINICISDIYITIIVFVLKKKDIKLYVNLENFSTGRKQLKHKSRFYDLLRTDNEVNINDYNPVLLTVWEANYLWNIALRFTNNRECILLYGTDQNTTIKWLYVNQIRYRKLKNRKEIEALDAESTDIFYLSLIDNHYPHSPNELHNMYLYRGYLINYYRYDVNTHSENYFFSLLMLQPWQKLENLRNELKLHFVEALQYHERLKELQKAFELQKKINVSKMIAKLNMDQKRVFDKVINIIIKCWIKQNLNKDTAVASPTGIATFNIDGLTVYRLLQLPIEHGHIPKYKQLSDHVLKVLRADLKNVILFVIDEVPMIKQPGFQNK